MLDKAWTTILYIFTERLALSLIINTFGALLSPQTQHAVNLVKVLLCLSVEWHLIEAPTQARSQVVCWGGAKHVISGLNHAVA